MIDNERLNELRKLVANRYGSVTLDFADLEWLLDTVDLSILVHQENFNLMDKIYKLEEQLNQNPTLKKKIP